MAPTYRNGDTVLVNRLSYIFTPPHINEIIALKDPRDQKILIKRIEKIENKRYFVIGDNKHNSTDSREFGMIGMNDIVGKVF